MGEEKGVFGKGFFLDYGVVVLVFSVGRFVIEEDGLIFKYKKWRDWGEKRLKNKIEILWLY